MEAENRPTLHLVLPWKIELVETLSKILVTESEQLRAIRDKAKEFLQKKKQLQITYHHKLATFLCPKFRNMKILTSVERDELKKT